MSRADFVLVELLARTCEDALTLEAQAVQAGDLDAAALYADAASWASERAFAICGAGR